MTGLPLQKRAFSLRGHLYLYLVAMLVLILVLWGNAHVSLQSTVTDFKSVTEREFVELRRMVLLRDVTYRTVEPIYRYMAWGNPDELALFEDNAVDVNQAFADVMSLDTLSEGQRALMDEALREWQRASNVGRAIFEIPNIPEELSHLTAAGDIFDRHISMVNNMLYEAHSLRVLSIESLQEAAIERHSATQRIMVVVFLGSLLIFGIASITMASQIIRPLDLIRNGIARIAEGDLSHRIGLDNGNELGELARGINNMAERLEQDQDALEEMAIIDSLTGLYNRREFERLLDEELHRARRYQHALSLLLIDIDKFKEVNDTLGHRAGDKALQVVSEVIRDISRKGDVVARYGGDELAVLLPETPIEDAMIIAERIRQRTGHEDIRLEDDSRMNLTLSIGAATISNEVISGEQLVDTADRAMYLAKTGGRNRVCRNDNQGRMPKVMP